MVLTATLETRQTSIGAEAPIGIFDSGIGGLSVLRHIREQLPAEQLLYFADSGFAPYGDKTEQEIIARSLSVAAFLMQYRIKALVVACNTATAAAIKILRDAYPDLSLIGVEPGLKPAAEVSKTRVVGVLATERTLASDKFRLLREQISSTANVEFLAQPCIGLADQIEKGALHSSATAIMLQKYIRPLLEQGADTLVLGCTHYPFVQPLIEEIIHATSSRSVTLIDTGSSIARYLKKLLEQHGLINTANEINAMPSNNGLITAFTTGSASALKNAFAALLKLKPTIYQIGAEEKNAKAFASAS